MPQADPAQRVVDRREAGDHAAAALQLALEFGEREVWRRFDQPAQVGFVGPEHAPPVPRRADRAAPLDRADDAQAQIHGHRGRDGEISAGFNRYCRITG
jgi:hypothetical protein